MCSFSSIGFSYFGSLLAKLGNIRVGHLFTSLAKRLSERLEAKECSGEVLAVVCEVSTTKYYLFSPKFLMIRQPCANLIIVILPTQIQCFVEPLQSANELRKEGEAAAMADGNINVACAIRLQYCFTMFWSGVKLSVANDTVSKACQFMKERGHETTLYFIIPLQKVILTLMGSGTEAVTDSELSRSIRENKNPRQLMGL